MLIGQEGEKHGLINLRDALEQAQQSELDLVQVSPNGSEPIVCKLMDYGKHVFAKKKSISSSKAGFMHCTPARFPMLETTSYSRLVRTRSSLCTLKTVRFKPCTTSVDIAGHASAKTLKGIGKPTFAPITAGSIISMAPSKSPVKPMSCLTSIVHSMV